MGTRRVGLAFALLAVVAPAQAGATEPVTEQEHDEAPPPSIWGRLHMDASPTLFLPRGGFAQTAPTGGGVAIRVLLALKKVPVAVGMGVHLLAIDGRQVDEGVGGLFSDGEWIIGTTTSRVETSLRMLDVIARLEPNWTRVRPFAEATLGFGAYHTTWRRSLDADNTTLAEADRQDDATWTSGLGVGINIEPWHRHPITKGQVAWMFTLGVRRMWGGHINYVAPATMDDAGRTVIPRTSPSLEALVPYIGLGFAVVGPASGQKF